MANETTLVLKRSEPIDFIVANGTAIEKGTICMLSGPRTAAANDGRTRLSGFTGPGDILVMTAAAGPTIAAGAFVTTSGPNLIRLATEAEVVLGKGIGKTMESIAGAATGEVMLGCI
jgi:hypothetical protein